MRASRSDDLAEHERPAHRRAMQHAAGRTGQQQPERQRRTGAGEAPGPHSAPSQAKCSDHAAPQEKPLVSTVVK